MAYKQEAERRDDQALVHCDRYLALERLSIELSSEFLGCGQVARTFGPKLTAKLRDARASASFVEVWIHEAEPRVVC
jgi:hypothetical protein